ILVCRKRAFDRRSRALGATASARAFDKGVEKAARLRSRGFDLSRNDRRVILYSQFLTEVGPVSTAEDLAQILHEQQAILETMLDEPALCNSIAPREEANSPFGRGAVQRFLFD